MGSPRTAFTLAEVTAVVVLLGGVAAVAVPAWVAHVRESRVAAARYAHGALATAVVQARCAADSAGGGSGRWPTDLGPLLRFPDGQPIANPYHEEGQPVYHVLRGDNRWHPAEKTIEWAAAANRGAIWYNPANGSVRFRVPDQGSPAATIALYNRVNGTDVTSLRQQEHVGR